MVLSQPFLRRRQEVHVVTPTCSSHRERLTTAELAMGCVLPFNSIFTAASCQKPEQAGVASPRPLLIRLNGEGFFSRIFLGLPRALTVTHCESIYD